MPSGWCRSTTACALDALVCCVCCCQNAFRCSSVRRDHACQSRAAAMLLAAVCLAVSAAALTAPVGVADCSSVITCDDGLWSFECSLLRALSSGAEEDRRKYLICFS